VGLAAVNSGSGEAASTGGLILVLLVLDRIRFNDVGNNDEEPFALLLLPLLFVLLSLSPPMDRRLRLLAVVTTAPFAVAVVAAVGDILSSNPAGILFIPVNADNDAAVNDNGNDPFGVVTPPSPAPIRVNHVCISQS
jgi:hypothetical protein